MTIFIRVSLLLFVCIFVFASIGGAAAKGRSTLYELMVDGLRRNYFVYCPKDCKYENMPLMIVLHGGLGNALEIEKRTGMNELADSGPFVVVYPDGIEGQNSLKNRRTWNAGDCCGISARRKIDDVLFIERVIDQVEQNYSIDSRRVYVAGMSNGGMMAYRLASEIPQKVAAVIVISADLAVDNFDAAKNVAVLHIHGTDDRLVPVAGGVGEKSITNVSHRSLAETVNLITRARQCAAPEVTMVGRGVQSSLYRCSQGAPVEVVLLQGGRHEWPGGHGRRDDPGRNFSASQYAWDFARKFSLTTK